MFTGKQVDLERADFENIANKKSPFPFDNLDWQAFQLHETGLD
jgi:hypothetical protein